MRCSHGLFVPVLFFVACQQAEPQVAQVAAVADPEEESAILFELDAERTGIDHANMIVETDEHNYFNYEYMYNGGGVAIGDVNGDGLPDVYLTGNMVPDRLYLNKGDLRFEDITEKALPKVEPRGWHSGVTMADVNGDGHVDIYVCRSGWSTKPSERTNLLFINNGDGSFKEEAQRWGVADTTRSTQAIFFDMDLDGDLDLYVLNHPVQSEKLSNIKVKELIDTRRSPTDRLFRNDGDRFTDITAQAGIWNMGYGLGVAVSDLNGDGLPDIYVANDYIEPDYMYINQGNGRFRNEIQERTRHISNFGMGCDVADYDNDGLVDVIVMDMVAEDHYRNKTNMGAMNPDKFWKAVQAGMHYQFMFNTLQRNNGNGTFSEMGQLAGVSKTDWSWAPLFADLDNDGWKDLLITNGYKRDARDNDFNIRSKALQAQNKPMRPSEVLELIPSNRIRNYLYKNNGDLTFKNVSKAWGFDRPVNSNGCAYADLDGDGDLDLVVNHIDEKTTVFENQAVQQGKGNHLRLELEGAYGALAMGAQATVTTANGVQYQELMTTRGYQSSVEPVLHFGLGTEQRAATVTVRWPDGLVSEFRDVPAGKLSVARSTASRQPAKAPVRPLLAEDASLMRPTFTHVENPYDDFEAQVLLPHKRSEDGPMMATADVDGDGLEDLFIGGARGQAGVLYLQKAGGVIQAHSEQPWTMHRDREDQAPYFFDANGDGRVDLLVLSGSNETDQEVDQFQPRLYLNMGNGRFQWSEQAIPFLQTSGHRGAIADVDGDGDLDLFVGGRVVPGTYPMHPKSYLLLNDGTGRFTDATSTAGEAFAEAGMVTDAAFFDIDADGDLDLVTVGEWMPISVYRNQGGRFGAREDLPGTQETEGWWNRLVLADLDRDGDLDLVVGNIGWNSKFQGKSSKPVHLYFNDFDGNGRPDIVLAKKQGETMVPVRGRECSSQQCPMILQKFPSYDAFASATLDQIYTPEKLSAGLHLQARYMYSAVAWNDKGTFRLEALPMLAQAGPIKGIVVHDVDRDGHLDIIAAGNHWGAEVETIRYDGGTGLVLRGDGKGSFQPMPIPSSGFFAWLDARDVALVPTSDPAAPLLVVSNNNGPAQIFRTAPSTRGIAQR